MARKEGSVWELYDANDWPDETREIVRNIIEWRKQVCDRTGLPYRGSALNKDETAWIRDKVASFHKHAPGVAMRLRSYQALGKDAQIRLKRSALRSFVCQFFGREQFFDLMLCFGKVKQEMVDILNELLLAKQVEADGSTKSQASPRGSMQSEGEHTVRGPNHKRCSAYEARKAAQKTIRKADAMGAKCVEEDKLIKQGKLRKNQRTTDWAEMDDLRTTAEETLS